MYRQRKKPLNQASKQDTSWIPRAVETIRDLASAGHDVITANLFRRVFLLNDGSIMSHATAEQHLRKLTQMGWLHMAARRDENNNFVQYEWELLR